MHRIYEAVVHFAELIYGWLRWLFQGQQDSLSPKQDEAPWLRYARSVVLLSLLLFPAGFWFASLLQQETTTTPIRSIPTQCPPTPPVPLEEASRYPERFLRRPIWLAGTLHHDPQQCFPKPCPKGTCCPCRANLRLRHGSLSTPIHGLVRGKLLACQGNTCKFSCGPLPLLKPYALFGTIRMSAKPGPIPQFQLRSFHVSKACRLPKLSNELYRHRLKDPILPHLRPRKKPPTTPIPSSK